MARKSIYETTIKNINIDKFKSFQEKEMFLDKQVKEYFDKKSKKSVFRGKQNFNDYDNYSIPNPRKTFGQDNYFIDKNPQILKVSVYKVKDDKKPYSPLKNSELVYQGGLDKNSQYKDYVGIGKL
jgi:hypothetical protein